MAASRPLLAVALCAFLAACSAPTPTPTTSMPTAAPTSALPADQTPATSASASAPGSPSASASVDAALDSPDRPREPLKHVQLPGMTTPPPGLGLARYLNQTPSWKSCPDQVGLDCADVLAPLDYARPDDTAITLHLTRRKAIADRKGVMFVNPGGPGEPSDGITASKRWRQLPGFDIVGWDTRGTGGSTPVTCYPDDATATRQLDQLTAVDVSPDDEAEYETLRQEWAGFAASCGQYSGDYLSHISTLETVQDMDLLRQLLGEQKLNFTGYSYGTWLGSVYATKFPGNVGRMVLDSAVNVTEDTSIPQSEGFDRALGLFADWEARQGKLGRDHAAVVGAVGKLLDDLDTKPIPAGGRDLTQALALSGIVSLLYGDEREWQMLETALVAASRRGDGSQLLFYADQMNDRRDNGTYGVRFASFPAILCVDTADKGLSAARVQWGKDIEEAPFFGRYFGPSVTCETWVVPPAEQVKVSAPTSAPIVVVGSTGDSATPFEFAGWMADALGSGVLLTWDGPGHGSYGNGNACLDGAVNAYVNDGVVPAKGTVCKP